MIKKIKRGICILGIAGCLSLVLAQSVWAADEDTPWTFMKSKIVRAASSGDEDTPW